MGPYFLDLMKFCKEHPGWVWIVEGYWTDHSVLRVSLLSPTNWKCSQKHHLSEEVLDYSRDQAGMVEYCLGMLTRDVIEVAELYLAGL